MGEFTKIWLPVFYGPIYGVLMAIFMQGSVGFLHLHITAYHDYLRYAIYDICQKWWDNIFVVTQCSEFGRLEEIQEELIEYCVYSMIPLEQPKNIQY